MATFDWSEVSESAHQAFQSGDFKGALKILRRWFKRIERECGTTSENLGWTCMTVGRCYYEQAGYAQAHVYLRRATRILHRRYPYKAAYAFWCLSLCYEKQKQYLRAVRAMFHALENSSKVEALNSWTCFVYCCVSKLYLLAKDYEKAKQAFENGIKAGRRKESTLSNVLSIASFLRELTVAPDKLAKAPWGRKLLKSSYKLLRTKISELEVPASEVVSQSDVLFGTTIEDPYRWLENVHSPTVNKWVDSQMAYSSQYLGCLPGRLELSERSSELYSEKKPDLEYKVGDYFFTQDSAETVLKRSRRRRQLKSSKVVIDSSSLPEHLQLVRKSVSPDGEKLVYWVSQRGSDWQTLYTKDINTGKLCRGILRNMLFSSIQWKDDSTGFYYIAISEIDDTARVRFHKISQAQSRDRVICRLPANDVMTWISGSIDDRYLVINTSSKYSLKYGVLLVNLTGRGPKIQTLVKERPVSFAYVGCTDDRLYFSTDWNAQLGRVVSCSKPKSSGAKISAGSQIRWREEVCEKTQLLSRAFVWGDLMCCMYDTAHGDEIQTAKVDKLDKFKKLVMPANSVLVNSGWLDYPNITVHTEGYALSTKSFDLNLETLVLKSTDPVKLAFPENEFITRRLSTRSKDGKSIPFYVTHKKGLELNGNNPTILTGYGGFNHDVSPALNHYDIMWMEQGGICAEAILRGDGKLGTTWRKQGTLAGKQHTFDDFIAVARTLVRKKYTRPEKLGIRGYSNGGLLTAAMLTQQPKLFGAVVIGFGLLDMIRFHKFENASRFQSEYGSPDKRAEFDFLKNTHRCTG